MPELVLVKLGGSLITDKRKRETVRRRALGRLATEIVAGSAGTRARTIVGHGGGSFGHHTAARHGLNRGRLRREQIGGVSRTQDRAAVLHRMVIESLLKAGARPFSLAPSSLMTAVAGRPATLKLEPLELALALDTLPVVYGDVVLDREWGACICSTETVFVALARRMLRRGYIIRRALWMGETEGVYDVNGATIPRLDRRGVRRALRDVGGAEGADVTGGMAHRLDAAAALAGLGIPSWILDGTVPGRLRDALAGRSVAGTRVEPDRAPHPARSTKSEKRER